MKKLFTIFATFALLCAVGCEEKGDDNVDPNDKTEQPGEKPDDGSEIPDDAYISINKDILTFSPDGESVDIKVYSNYEWTLTNNCEWVTTSISGGEASEGGTTITLSADLTYDDREGTIIFSCGKAKKVLVVSQSFKEAIIADENNTFNIPAEGGVAVLNYETTVDCEVVIPMDAKSWITIVPANTRGLVAENINLDIAENTTYSARSAVVKVVMVGNSSVVAEYTINQEQNDAIIADKNNTFTVPSEGGNVTIDYQTNVECEIIIPEDAKDWLSLAPTTRALEQKSATIKVAENTTYSARSAVIKVVMVGNEELVAEYTINQEQIDAIIADKNNTFTVPSKGGNVTIEYQTNVECEIIIPEEATDWLSLAPTTRALVQKSATIKVAENTTYSARSAVVKVVMKGNKELVAEYIINQEQNDSIIAGEENTFTVPCEGGNVTIDYRTNVECEIIIPEEAQNWLSLAPATRALVQESVTINVAENNTGAERSTVVKVVKKDDNSLCAEYIINQEQHDAIIVDGNNTFNIKGWSQSITLDYKTNVACEVVIPEEAQSWLSLAPTTRALVQQESVTINVAENNTGAERSTVVSVVAKDNNALIAEYTITQNQRYIIQYTSTNGKVVRPTNGFDAKIFSNTYENGVGIIEFEGPITSIGRYAFYGCSSLASINIPNRVTSIGNFAFEDCSSLASVNIPYSVTSIGDYAFSDCTSLTSITIPDGVTEIGFGAFYNCSSLTSVTIPDSVTSIGNSAFSGCSSLACINIGNGVTSIGRFAFNGCSSLASINIPNRVTSIGEYAFQYCGKLTCINIGNGVTSIGSFAFNGCSSLASINIPNRVTSIGKYAFQYCGKLTSITIPYSVTSIGEGAFYGFEGELIINSRIVMKNYTSSSYPKEDGWLYGSKLSKLTIGDNVKQIGEYTFYHCSSLTSVTIGNGVTSIGDDAFSDCTSLTSITIPDGVTEIGFGAFYNCSSLESVYCRPTTPPTGDKLMFFYFTISNKGPIYRHIGCAIYVPTESVEAYKAAEYWCEYAEYIEPYQF